MESIVAEINQALAESTVADARTMTPEEHVQGVSEARIHATKRSEGRGV